MIDGGHLWYILPSIIGAYMFLCLGVGFKNAYKVTSLKEFALGYDKISTALLVATMYATYLGAGDSLGLIERINNIGVVCAFVAGMRILGWYIARSVFCDNVAKFSGCLSQAHVMERLYGGFGCSVSKFLTLICSVGYIAIQIMVISSILQYFFGISHVVGTVVGSLVVTCYTISGGVKAVILTDLVQVILFALVIGAVFVLSAIKVFNQEDFWQTIPIHKAWIVPYDGHSLLLVLGLVVYALLPVGTDAPSMQRILISSSSVQLRKCFSYVAIIDFVIVCAIGCVGVFLLPNTGDGILSRSDIFELVKTTMNPVFVFAVILGLLALTMSTADSWLNSSAVIATQVVLQRKGNLSDVEQVRVARIMTAVIGILAAYVAFIGDSILSLMLFVACFESPLLLVPISAGFLGYQFTEWDYKRSVFLSVITVLLGAYIEGEFGFISLLFGLMGSTIGLTLSKGRGLLKVNDTSCIPIHQHQET
ncbi:MAG: sodium:solute symporter family protein [Proteobacteria bacterium]|nr:sodium:solute symporter family protein [Pseudomonadota bacterium]